MITNKPIGVLDSGIGGTTVLAALVSLMPYENFVYLGDTRNLPYGNKPELFVRRRSKELGQALGDMGIKLLVVACHTISAYVAKELEKDLGLPVINMIEPTFDLGVRITKNKKVGVLGTENLVFSQAYKEVNKKSGSLVQLHSKPCPELVPLIEAGRVRQQDVNKLLGDIKETQVDVLLLACTHYSLMKRQIARALPNIIIVDPAMEVARRVRRELITRNLLNEDPPGGVRLLFTQKRRSKKISIEEEIIRL